MQYASSDLEAVMNYTSIEAKWSSPCATASKTMGPIPPSCYSTRCCIYGRQNKFSTCGCRSMNLRTWHTRPQQLQAPYKPYKRMHTRTHITKMNPSHITTEEVHCSWEDILRFHLLTVFLRNYGIGMKFP